MKKIKIFVLPRQQMTRAEFLDNTPRGSIALDGMVSGGPFFNMATNHLNCDHHDGVVREATMSSAMQVYYAIKGGMMNRFMHHQDIDSVSVYINDTDQDTALAVWILLNHKLFEGVQSVPIIGRLLALNDRLDITGGAFPMNLDDRVLHQQCWVFEPYTNLRKSGALATANAQVLMDNLDATMSRISRYMMGDGEESEPDIRYTILYDSPEFKIVDEIGGSSARTHLFDQGMRAFISLVATRPDGKRVWSVGRMSQYIDFPVLSLYGSFNKVEGFKPGEGWGGSDIVGGSSRLHGSSLSWQELRDLTLQQLEKK